MLSLGTVCLTPVPGFFAENNTVGATVVSITTQAGVSLEITENPYDAFEIRGNLLVAIKVLDYEVIISFVYCDFV